MPSAHSDRHESAPRESGDNPLLIPDWRAIARGYEDEMRAAQAQGQTHMAQLWRDCADVAWSAAEESPWT